VNRGVGRRAEGREQQQNLVVLDQAPRLFHGFGGVVTVVQADQAKPAAIDATLGVDLGKVRGLGAAKATVGG
jgi:hypothetical protein